MSEEKVHPVPADLAASAHINAAKYEEMYRRSVDDPDGFWADAAEEFVSWSKMGQGYGMGLQYRRHQVVPRRQTERLL